MDREEMKSVENTENLATTDVAYEVPSVALAMSILKLLSRYKTQSCTLTEISKRTHASKTTCLRVLRTLARGDFIRYDKVSRCYSLGAYLIPLGNRASQMVSGVSEVMLELPRLAEKVGETVMLLERLPEDAVIVLAKAAPSSEVARADVSIGQLFAGLGGAFGRCFLAYDAPSAWRKHWMKMTATGDRVAKMWSSQETFYEALETTRRVGAAVSHGEMAAGFSSVAVPLFASDGSVALVLAVLLLTSQYQEERGKAMIRILQQTAERWRGLF
ncbi:IclR family transcriptional regulator [Alicyclobacillus tolerans]|uniref:IclR family transcriptional regulator n=1 Tax=Alicyclobacillus tolerans TaxID=90970 RepID=UPI003B7F5B18